MGKPIDQILSHDGFTVKVNDEPKTPFFTITVTCQACGAQVVRRRFDSREPRDAGRDAELDALLAREHRDNCPSRH